MASCSSCENRYLMIQCRPFIILYFGSIGMDCVISKSNGHFPIICFVKFHGKKIWEPEHDPVITKSML